MAIVIPDWLKAPDIGADFARGVALGQQANQAQQRLQAQAAESQMRAQAQAAQIKRQSMVETARVQASAAYQNQQISLQQQRLQQAEQAINLRTRAAADALAARTRYSALLQQNPDMPQSEALIRSGFGSAANVGAARTAEVGERQRAEDFGLRRQAETRLQRDLERREQEAKFRRDVPVVVGSESEVSEDESGVRKTTRRNIFGRAGENAPSAPKPLTPELARDFLKQARGDKAAARQLAKDAGYSF